MTTRSGLRRKSPTLDGPIVKPSAKRSNDASLLVKLQVPSARFIRLESYIEGLLNDSPIDGQTVAPVDPTVGAPNAAIPPEDVDMDFETAPSETPSEDLEMFDSGIALDGSMVVVHLTAAQVNAYHNPQIVCDAKVDGDAQIACEEHAAGDAQVGHDADAAGDATTDGEPGIAGAAVFEHQKFATPTDRPGLNDLFDKMMAPLLSKIEDKPLPCGEPPVWSNTRQALNETCSYYRAYQGGSYGDSEGMRGMMFDGEADEFDLVSAQVVIARGGGGRDVGEDKVTRTQTKDQTETWTVRSMKKNIENQEPIAIILGDRYDRTLVRMPHVYNVLGWFKPTDSWWCKVNGKKVIRYRLEKHNLNEPSWWVPADYVEETPLGCMQQDPAARKMCAKCDSTWDTVYTIGWMCLNGACPAFWKVPFSGPLLRDAPSKGLRYDPRFLNKRTVWMSNQDPEPLVADRSVVLDTQNSMNVLRHGSKGIVCPRCGNCVRRLRMTGAAWRCDAPQCGFAVEVAQMNLRLNWVLDHERPVGRDTVPRNRDTFGAQFSGFFEKRQFYNGGYRVRRYDIKDTDCFVVHLIPNLAPLEADMGANQLFDLMQRADLPLVRRALSAAPTRGNMVTNHYTLNIVSLYPDLFELY
jgi:hypothetical protein